MLPKGSFNNYMDQILPNFDHLLPLSGHFPYYYYLVTWPSLDFLMTTYLPTFSCQRSYWMTPNQAYQWSRVGCSFSADTYIFRHGAGSAKNGCSIVEERLLSAIKEDGVEAKKRPELRRHFYREKLKLSAVSHFHWTDTHPNLHDFFFDIHNECKR